MTKQDTHNSNRPARRNAGGLWLGVVLGLGAFLLVATTGLAQPGGSSGSSVGNRSKRFKNWHNSPARAKLLKALAARAKARKPLPPAATPPTPARRTPILRIPPTPIRRTPILRLPRTPIRPVPPTPVRRPTNTGTGRTRTPTPATPAARTRKISYGGLLYDDHSANTTMTPTTIPVGGTFRITSRTMRFAGPGVDLRVVLEVQNRRAGSFGVTRLRLMGVRVQGNTLIVLGPQPAVYGGQSYRVVVVTLTNRRPDSYASPGYLRVLAAPQPAPTPTISYGGIYYNDHSGNTTMTPTTIPVGGTFRITSRTMQFSGPNTVLRVVLEVQNRRPGSFGVTRLQLRGVRVSGNTLIVRGPDQPIYGNQSYRVVVVTYTNRRPDSYASPGYLRVNR